MTDSCSPPMADQKLAIIEVSRSFIDLMGMTACKRSSSPSSYPWSWSRRQLTELKPADCRQGKIGTPLLSHKVPCCALRKAFRCQIDRCFVIRVGSLLPNCRVEGIVTQAVCDPSAPSLRGSKSIANELRMTTR